MHIIPEYYSSYPVTWFSPRQNRFKDIIDQRLFQLVESGIVSHWKEVELDHANKLVASRKVVRDQNKITMETLAMSFIFFVCSMTLTSLVFTFELVFNKEDKLKKKTNILFRTKNIGLHKNLEIHSHY